MKILIFIDVVDIKDISNAFFLKMRTMLGNADIQSVSLLTVLSPLYMLCQYTCFVSGTVITESERHLQAKMKLQRVAKQLHLPNCFVQYFVKTGAPTDRILHLASESHADMIVIPLHLPLSGSLMRSPIGASILKKAQTSVLFVPIKNNHE
jgi:Universal stress protein family.